MTGGPCACILRVNAFIFERNDVHIRHTKAYCDGQLQPSQDGEYECNKGVPLHVTLGTPTNQRVYNLLPSSMRFDSFFTTPECNSCDNLNDFADDCEQQNESEYDDLYAECNSDDRPSDTFLDAFNLFILKDDARERFIKMSGIFKAVTNQLQHDYAELMNWWNHVLSWVPANFKRHAEIDRQSILESGNRLILHLTLVSSEPEIAQFVQRMEKFQNQIDVNTLVGLQAAPNTSHAKRALPVGYSKRKKSRKSVANNSLV